MTEAGGPDVELLAMLGSPLKSEQARQAALRLPECCRSKQHLLEFCQHHARMFQKARNELSRGGGDMRCYPYAQVLLMMAGQPHARPEFPGIDIRALQLIAMHLKLCPSPATCPICSTLGPNANSGQRRVRFQDPSPSRQEQEGGSARPLRTRSQSEPPRVDMDAATAHAAWLQAQQQQYLALHQQQQWQQQQQQQQQQQVHHMQHMHQPALSAANGALSGSPVGMMGPHMQVYPGPNFPMVFGGMPMPGGQPIYMSPNGVYGHGVPQSSMAHPGFGPPTYGPQGSSSSVSMSQQQQQQQPQAGMYPGGISSQSLLSPAHAQASHQRGRPKSHSMPPEVLGFGQQNNGPDQQDPDDRGDGGDGGDGGSGHMST